MFKATQSAPLSDIQRHVLTTALLRPDGAAAVREAVKGHIAATRVGQALLGKALVREVRAKGDLPVWRHDAESGRAFSLVLTKAGRACVAQSSAPATVPTTASDVSGKTDGHGSALAADDGRSPSLPRAGSKLAEVIALLRRAEGSRVGELMAVTGWLPHTTRAALTGLRKRGYTVTREAAAAGSVYRISGTAAGA